MWLSVEHGFSGKFQPGKGVSNGNSLHTEPTSGFLLYIQDLNKSFCSYISHYFGFVLKKYPFSCQNSPGSQAVSQNSKPVLTLQFLLFLSAQQLDCLIYDNYWVSKGTLLSFVTVPWWWPWGEADSPMAASVPTLLDGSEFEPSVTETICNESWLCQDFRSVEKGVCSKRHFVSYWGGEDGPQSIFHQDEPRCIFLKWSFQV